MRILILSDNHYKNIDLDFKSYDYLFHCGDYGKSLNELEENGFIFVRGNTDLYGYKINEEMIGDKKFLITHGDLYGVKYDYQHLIAKALEENANFVLFGHTHVQTVFKENDIYFINPGSYKDGSYIEIVDDEIILYEGFKELKKIKL